jgi:hypothetical protein
MKRLSLTFVLLLTALLIVGCGPAIVGSGQVVSVDRPVSDFDQVELQGLGELEIIQGETESLQVEVEDNLLPYLVTEVHGGRLEIGFHADTPLYLRPTRPVRFTLTLKNVTALQVSGSGQIHADRLAAERLQLGVSGSGSLTVDLLEVASLTNSVSGSGDLRVGRLQAASVETTISGSGNCKLVGETLDQSARVSGSGDYRAFNLQSQTADLHLSGSGSAQTWVANNLEVTLSGSGGVEYYGAPIVSQQVAGSGRVTSLGVH